MGPQSLTVMTEQGYRIRCSLQLKRHRQRHDSEFVTILANGAPHAPRHCEEQSDEQSSLPSCGEERLDCFAALAMTMMRVAQKIRRKHRSRRIVSFDITSADTTSALRLHV